MKMHDTIYKMKMHCVFNMPTYIYEACIQIITKKKTEQKWLLKGKKYYATNENNLLIGRICGIECYNITKIMIVPSWVTPKQSF